MIDQINATFIRFGGFVAFVLSQTARSVAYFCARMLSGISFSGLWGWLVLSLLLSIFAAFLLYFRQKELDYPEGKTWMRWLLPALRALGIWLVILLLINPLVRKNERRVELPVLLVAMDASSSMVQGKDSAGVRKTIANVADRFRSALSEKFDLQFVAFGEKFRNQEDELSWNDKQTDISEVFEQSSLLFEGRNLQGIVLLSDGLYNRGQNPQYLAEKSGVPIFGIGVGDSSVRKDLRINSIRTNAMVYAGNRFPVEIDLQSRKIPQGTSLLRITHNGVLVHSEQIIIDQEEFNSRISVMLEAPAPGNQRYVVSLSAIQGEVTLSNNQREFFMDVLEGRQKILLLAKSPGPDIGAYKRAIERNSNYELEMRIGPQAFDPIKPGTYDLIIIAGLGNDSRQTALIHQFVTQKQHWLGIVAVQPNISVLNTLESGLRITGLNNSFNDAVPILQKEFSYFELDKELMSRFQQMPPMLAPYGNYRIDEPGGILLAQKIGAVKTQYPLIYLQNQDDIRHGLVLGEGFWKWQLYEFERYGDQRATDELLGKMIQFLTRKNDRRPFRVKAEKRIIPENEPIRFSAEVYDQNQSPITAPEVRLTLFSEDKKQYTYSFSRRSSDYELDAGRLPAGVYTYKATTNTGGKQLQEQGSIVVSKLDAELLEQSADFHLMRSMGAATGGAFYLLHEADRLIEQLRNSEEMAAVSYQNVRLSDLIQIQWILFLIALLFGTEWILRRWLGSY